MNDPWISVQEAMPHAGQKCLVYGDRFLREPEFMAIATWTALKGWWPIDGRRVTYWQPCPAPPRRPSNANVS